MKIILLLPLFCLYSNSVATLDREWWKNTIVYQIIPYAFKDSDGDGIGDLKGITMKLDHFVDLGIETLHLTPIHPTTFRDMGYDVTDYYQIDPKYGTMADFEELVREMKKKNLKFILDLVINHSSYKHEWFEKSINRTEPYTDFYVWKDPKGFDPETGEPIKPNNWSNEFEFTPYSGWTWNEKRQQFYFHQFLAEQPDFNMRNEILKKELKKIIKYWLDKGIAGFRIDAVQYFIEDENFSDNENDYERDMQLDREDNYELTHELRLLLDEYNQEHGGIERIFIPEAHTSMEYIRKYYDRPNYPISQLPYTFFLRYIYREIDADELNSIITEWIDNLPENAISAWVTDDHDNIRTADRIRPEYMDILTITAMLLPGSVGIYYGQEIGMKPGYIYKDQIRDFSSQGQRDPTRLSMQWDNTINGGFSRNNVPFIPPNTDYYYRNVDVQKNQKISHYNLFKDLSKLRQTDTLKYGDFKSYVPSKFIYIFTRAYKGEMFIIAINLNNLLSILNLTEVISKLPNTISIATASTNSGYYKGFRLNCDLRNEFAMQPYSSVVLKAHNS